MKNPYERALSNPYERALASSNPKLPPRRLTHKDAKLAAELHGLTYEEIRERERAFNEEWRRENVVLPQVGETFERNGMPAQAEDAAPPAGHVYGSCTIKI